MPEVLAFFQQGPAVEAIGIGSFGPIDLHRESAGYGRITSTPKLEWRNYDIVAAVQTAFGAPVGFDTDVDAAALAEGRWGAGKDVRDFVYLTIGTGIGGGAIVNGAAAHGLAHSEMGHTPVPHDRTRDPFPGCCPYHGDCLEGLASGPALQARWGTPADLLPADHPAWELEAHYLALGLSSLVYAFSPRRLLLGGGVMRQAHLFDLIRRELARLVNGYVCVGEVLPPQLGQQAGVLGGLVLAEQALARGADTPR